MIELLTDPAIWIAFFTLTAMELVLGIDNVIFISILVDKLPAHQRNLARKIGLFGAMFMRIGLLFLLAWIVGMTKPLISLLGMDFSGRDLVLLGGALFLIWKSTTEIHEALAGKHTHHVSGGTVVKAAFASIIMQIMVIDLVFSLDSIITAVGMVD
ncbi:MAG: TerC family protein, partial [Burkholderiaceae bacterium]